MSGIFINYRRKDTAYQAGHIYDRLVRHFGEQVYKDVDSIQLGDDFVKVIEQLIERSTIVLVLIGESWLVANPQTGRPRLEDADDLVRREIELALNGDKVVIPVVLGSAEIPEASKLPASIQALKTRNGLRVNPDPYFHGDTQRLIQTIEKHLKRVKTSSDAPKMGPVGGGQKAAFSANRGNRFLRILADLLAQEYPQEQRRVDVRGLARSLFTGWCFGTREQDRCEDLQALVFPSSEEMKAEVDLVASMSEPSDLPRRSRMCAYLTQVILRVRNSLVRGNRLGMVRLDREDDLLPFLPHYWPHFRPGDRPLPQVDWELLELLGAGGYGEVWKAQNPEFRGIPPVALKFCLDDSIRQKLLGYEAHLVSQILLHGSHPGIVQLRQAYLKANPPCLEYEFVDGGDLLHLSLPPAGAERVACVRKWIRQLAETVGHFHLLSPPVVHRDLKPANVLVARSSKEEICFRIADFGIGRLVADSECAAVSGKEMWPNMRPPTAVRTSYTPLYASPQQQRGDPPDPRDDVYSLGVMWYQLVSGNWNAGAPRGLQWSHDLKLMGMSSDDLSLLASCIEDQADLRPLNGAQLAMLLGSNETSTSSAADVLRLDELTSASDSSSAGSTPSSFKHSVNPDSQPIRVVEEELIGVSTYAPFGGDGSLPSSRTTSSSSPHHTTVVFPTTPVSHSGPISTVRERPSVATDTESGTVRTLWLWFAICRGAGSLLWCCFLLFYLMAGVSESTTDQASLTSWGLIIILGSALYLVDTVLLLILLHYCWSLLQDVPDAKSPGQVVGMLFVPLFNLYWVFVAFYGLARLMNAQLRRCQIWKPHASEGLGLAVCILWSASVLLFLLSPAVSWFGGLAMLLVLLNSVLWILFTYSLTQASVALAATRNDSVAEPA